MSKKQLKHGTEIASGIYWINAPGGNFYLCEESDGLTLIDTGMPNRQKYLYQLLDELGYLPQDVKQILVTHADLDHAGSLAAIQAETGATVYAGEETAVHLTNGTAPKHLPGIMAFLLSRIMGSIKPVSSAIINTFSDGDSLPILGGMQTLATPGHTSGHFAFYCPTAGVLFAGDALNMLNGRLQAFIPLATADKEAATQSAIRLLELAPAVVACGHGKPLSNHGMDSLMQLFNQLR
jgi:glyoxylase-like metal-dependent hydrolase (beta-lactamase superfamily II)